MTIVSKKLCWIVGASLIGITACGGSGGGGNAPQPTANRAPAFSSATSISVSENTTGSFYTIGVSDPDGDAVTLSVVSGKDESVFAVDLNGRSIAFAQAPDFETPTDTNADNVYELTLQARDPAGLTAQLNLAVTVTNIAEQMALKRVGAGFSQPLFVTAMPGTSHLVVLEKGGRARLLDPANGTVGSVDLLDVY